MKSNIQNLRHLTIAAHNSEAQNERNRSLYSDLYKLMVDRAKNGYGYIMVEPDVINNQILDMLYADHLVVYFGTHFIIKWMY